MNNLSAILKNIFDCDEPNTVLATIVGVSGSTYRLPGARMLVLPDRRLGTISGGCLEEDVCKRAQWLTRNGAALITYDTGDDDEAVGYTLGCRGAVTLLLERVVPVPAYISYLQSCMTSGRFGTVATIVEADGGGPVAVGDRLCGDGTGGIVDKQITASLTHACDQALENQRSRLVSLSSPSGLVTAFIEVITPPVQLFIFGSGLDVDPVVTLGKLLGWRVHVVSERMNAATRARLSHANNVTASSADRAHEAVRSGPRSAALIMTHHYDSDLALLGNLLRLELGYLGVLGPRHRTDAMLRKLEKLAPQEMRIKSPTNMFAPMGLNLGGDTPESIALSVISHIQSVLHQTDGQPLCEKQSSIHDRSWTEGPAGKIVHQVVCAVSTRP